MADQLIRGTWEQMPNAEDEYWVAMRRDGLDYLERLRRQQEELRKGQRPVINITSPVDREQIRAAETELLWNLNVPQGLKSFTLVVNNQAVATPAVRKRSRLSAPRSTCSLART